MPNLIQKLSLIGGIVLMSLSCHPYSKEDSAKNYESSKNQIEYAHTPRQLERAYRMKDRDFERMSREGKYEVRGMEMRDEGMMGREMRGMREWNGMGERRGQMMEGRGMREMREQMMEKRYEIMKESCKLDSCEMRGEGIMRGGRGMMSGMMEEDGQMEMRGYEMKRENMEEKGIMRGESGKGMEMRGMMMQGEGRGMMRGMEGYHMMPNGKMMKNSDMKENQGMMMNSEMKFQQEKMSVIIEKKTPVAVKGEKIKTIKESECDLTKCSLETKAQQDSCMNSLKK